MRGWLPGLLFYVGVVAEAKLVVLNQDELLLSRLVVGGWRVMVGGWWVMVGGWWLAVGDWWLVVGGWWLVGDG